MKNRNFESWKMQWPLFSAEILLNRVERSLSQQLHLFSIHFITKLSFLITNFTVLNIKFSNVLRIPGWDVILVIF